MKQFGWLRQSLGALMLGLTLAGPSQAAPAKSFAFALIPYPPLGEGNKWQQQMLAANEENLAFVLVNGLKSNAEACSDQVYLQRKNVFEGFEHGVVFSLAEQDWSACQKSDGRSNAVERLARLRELFYADEFSLGNSKLELIRLSRNPKFRNYPENARWEINGVLFATIHLPASNNRFRAEAGRNSEFEDRQVANRDWLKKLLVQAKTNQALVLISDGNLMGANYAKHGKLRSLGNERNQDGFADLQQKLLKLAEQYNGKILLIDHAGSEKSTPNIAWRGKFGTLSLPAQANAVRYIVQVNPARPQMFSLKAVP